MTMYTPPQLPIASNLTDPDEPLLRFLLGESHHKGNLSTCDAYSEVANSDDDKDTKIQLIRSLEAMNDIKSDSFQPTVFLSWDPKDYPKDKFLRSILDVYIRWGSGIARYPTDVVFVTHLILYFATSFPSALYLFCRFTWIHGALHFLMTAYYMGTYTLMRHNHIHNNGVLSRKLWVLDLVYPCIMDPLMGHTWNSYYYHHVKHHHVEGNGPDEISSTIRLQRDEWSSVALYIARFTFLIWLDLPLYFYRTGKWKNAVCSPFWAFSNYAFLFWAVKTHARAAFFVFIFPFAFLRLGLMIGNFGQYAFVDEIKPYSDFRSSITLIDVPSNRFCFNDGYHTAHHLNPRRYWRDQPVSFLKGKTDYEQGRALVFRNLDYLEITYRLMTKNYDHLARCLVPISVEQRGMTHEQIKKMLQTKTRRFSEEDIRKHWRSTERRK